MGLTRVNCEKCGRKMAVGNEYIGRDDMGRPVYSTNLRAGPFFCSRKSCRGVKNG